MVRLQLMEIPDDVLALILAACTVSELHCLAATSKRIKETSDERRRLIAVLEPFKKTFIGVLTCSDRMRLTARKLGDAEMQALSTALTGGAMAQLEVLYLTKNQIGDAGIQAFSTAIASGAMAQLKVSWRPSPLLGSLETWLTQELWLSNNSIGDAGVEALGKACVGGAMAQLQVHSVPTALSPDSET